MTPEQLKQGNALANRIKRMEEELSNIKFHRNHTTVKFLDCHGGSSVTTSELDQDAVDFIKTYTIATLEKQIKTDTAKLEAL